MHVIRVKEREMRESRTEKSSEKINSHNEEVQWTPCRINKEIHTNIQDNEIADNQR